MKVWLAKYVKIRSIFMLFEEDNGFDNLYDIT